MNQDLPSESVQVRSSVHRINARDQIDVGGLREIDATEILNREEEEKRLRLAKEQENTAKNKIYNQ